MKQTPKIVLLFLIYFIDQSSSAKRVKTREDALAWLNKYGYNPCLNSDVQCSLSFTSIIETYQKRFGLKVTGKLDEQTQTHMNRPRCGNTDKPLSITNSASKVTKYKWSRSSLTYSVRGSPTQFSQTTTKNIIREAFKAWTDHVPLTIEETCSTCQADFVLDFLREDHRDGYPFDGVSGTLAHAFFPEDGRVHFDKDEPWTESFNDEKINLYLVAVHEIGHALGLDHTFNEDSIMYPSYQPMPKSRILPQPDRTFIQNLYGKKQSVSSSSTTTTTSTRKPTTTTTTTSFWSRRSSTTTRDFSIIPDTESPPRCRMILDAAFSYPDGTFHTFNAGILWRYLPDERTWEKQGSMYKQTYPGLPTKIKAGVYNIGSQEVIFFSNARAYYYDIDYRNRAKFRNEEILSRDLQSFIVGALYYRSAVHVVTTTTIRTFQLDNGYQQSSERNLADEFPRFSGRVKSAFSYGDLHHFFTEDGFVSVWNELLNTWDVLRKPRESNWFACSGTQSYPSKYVQSEKPGKRRGSQRQSYNQDHYD